MKRPAIIIIFSIILLQIFASVSFAAEDPERVKTFMAVKSLLVRGDTFQVVEYINGLGDPLLVARRYSELIQDFYWKQKSISRIVSIGRAGIQYCIQQASMIEKTDKDKARKLREFAATISYNIASYTWPGWDEKGIEITGRDLEAGMDAALLNLRLVREIGSPAIKHAYGYWMLGAHYLAAGHYDKAIRSFRSAMDRAKEAEARTFIWMADGYVGIAQMASGKEAEAGKTLYDQTINALNEMEGKEAKVFAGQLIRAKSIFVKTGQ